MSPIWSYWAQFGPDPNNGSLLVGYTTHKSPIHFDHRSKHKGLYPVSKANKTRLFDRLYGCILKKYVGRLLKLFSLWFSV